ncbi:MAG: DNA polymerase III subunit gamma/tau [Lentisphaerae bacterium]|nr:DNA polymerase III subunit gamma/tau [Lentisphaerota bacterium]
MAYEVLARKWRPQRFEDVVGQDHVVQTLRNAIESKRLAHAYLFVGSRGIGKTSIARIFARALNCATGPTITPCGTCDSCREIAAGTNMDVLEIDGASNNGVDQVRDLRDTVRYAPTRGHFKITIIDEVHMLSVPAFNALLKTLEEPPAHAKFIFATTEPQKIPATVLSRCQRFDLRRLAVPVIVERLRLMATAEKVTIDDDALLAVARGAEGGMRDAQSALDQLISFKGDTITEADVLSVFGLVARASLESLAAAILAGDVPAIITSIGELDSAGKDFQRLVVELMEHFRNLLVALNVDNPALHVELTDAQLAVLKQQAERTDTARVLRVVGVLTETEDRMKFALSRRTLLETALIRCARTATVVSLEEVLAQIQALRAGEGGMPVGAPASAARVTPPVAPAPSPPVAARPAPVPPPPVAGPAAPVTAPPAAPAPAAAVREPAAGRFASASLVETPEEYVEDLKRLTTEWKDLKEKISKRAVLAKSILADARPVAVDSARVVIGFDVEFPEEMQRFEAMKGRKAIESTVETVLRRKVVVEFVLVEELSGEAETPSSPAEVAPPAAVVPVSSSAAAGAPAGPRKGRSAQEWAKDETVRKTLELFNGSIVDVRE